MNLGSGAPGAQFDVLNQSHSGIELNIINSIAFPALRSSFKTLPATLPERVKAEIWVHAPRITGQVTSSLGRSELLHPLPLNSQSVPLPITLSNTNRRPTTNGISYVRGAFNGSQPVPEAVSE